MNDMILQPIVILLKLGNLHRSIGVIYLSLKSYIPWDYITFWISSLSRSYLIPKFICPILFIALRVASIPFFNKNWGVYSIYHNSKTSFIMAGITTTMIQLSLQLSINKKSKVNNIAPKVQNTWTSTEYFCLFWSPTT